MEYQNFTNVPIGFKQGMQMNSTLVGTSVTCAGRVPPAPRRVPLALDQVPLGA